MRNILIGILLAVIFINPITRHDVGVIIVNVVTLVLHIGQVLISPLTSL